MKHWYAIQTKHTKEFQAELNLMNQNYITYLPKTLKYIESNKEIKKILKPLFSNYIFVLIDNLKDDWSKINYTRGVKKIVNFDGSFPYVPNEIINELKSKEINGLISLSKMAILNLGTLCKINNKSFFNRLCKIKKIYKNNKVQVLLNFLENEIKYLVSKEDIESTISSMLNDLCRLFCGFTVMGGEKVYPELGDNPWEHPNTIYLEVSAPDVSLEDLNPDWTEDKYLLTD